MGFFEIPHKAAAGENDIDILSHFTGHILWIDVV